MHADLGEQGHKIGCLVRVGRVGPVDIDAVETGSFDETECGAGKVVSEYRAGGNGGVDGGEGAAADG